MSEKVKELSPNNSFGFIVGDDYIFSPPGMEHLHGTFVGSFTDEHDSEHVYFYTTKDCSPFKKSKDFKDCVGFCSGWEIAAMNGIGNLSLEEAEAKSKKALIESLSRNKDPRAQKLLKLLEFMEDLSNQMDEIDKLENDLDALRGGDDEDDDD